MERISSDLEFTVSEARAGFAKIIKQVSEEQVRVVLTRWGKPLAVLIPPREAGPLQATIQFPRNARAGAERAGE